MFVARAGILVLVSGLLLAGCFEFGAVECELKAETICPGADLSGQVLRNLDLSGADLSRVDLTGADLTGTNLAGANLIGANLNGAVAMRSNLDDANLGGANLSRARFNGASLRRVVLQGAIMEDTSWTQVSFEDTDLTGANFSTLNMTGASFSGAVLRAVNFQQTILRDTDLTGVDLRDADLTGARLTNADLRGADVSRTNLEAALDLSGVRLNNQALRSRVFERVSLVGADLTGADLTGTIFRLSRLEDVVWNRTVCPNGRLNGAFGQPCCTTNDEPGDGEDQNCDGVDGVDADGDGVASLDSGGDDCDDTVAAIKGGCLTEPGAPEDYKWDAPATYFDHIQIRTDDTRASDLNGDGWPDNALGPLMDSLLSLIGVNMQEYVKERVESGQLSIGAVWPSMNGDEKPEAHFFALEPGPEGTFVANRQGFVTGSKTPRSRVIGGQLSHQSAVLGPHGSIRMPMPFGNAMLDIEIHQPRLEASLEKEGQGMKVHDASLTGFVTKRNIVDGINDYLTSDACSCLTFEGQPLEMSDNGWVSCGGMVETHACTDLDQGDCASIARGCGILASVIAGGGDLDIDDDGQHDAFSVSIGLSGPAAEVVGPTEP